MSERVHPAEGDAAEHQVAAPGAASKELQLPPLQLDEKSKPPPGTYVIQVPKEQIFRTPTPETERRFKEYSRRRRQGRRGRSCCCCLCWVTGVLVVLALVLAAAAGVLYLVFRPQLPKYTVQSVSVVGFNLTAPGAALSPEFDVVVRAENPNRKVRIDYRGAGSSVVVSHSGVDLCRGSWPSFQQGTRNVTLIRTALRGSGIRLSGAMRGDLVAGEGRGAVPLEVRARVPVRVEFGAVTTWTITAKVRCDLTVDKLAASSKVVSASCGVKVKLL